MRWPRVSFLKFDFDENAPVVEVRVRPWRPEEWRAEVFDAIEDVPCDDEWRA